MVHERGWLVRGACCDRSGFAIRVFYRAMGPFCRRGMDFALADFSTIGRTRSLDVVFCRTYDA